MHDSNDRSRRRAERRMSPGYAEAWRKRRERKIARKLGLIPGSADVPPIRPLTRDDLERWPGLGPV